MRELKDKIIAITGGATGIGFALAKSFGKDGAKIVVGEPREAERQKAVEELKNLDIEANETHLDVTYICELCQKACKTRNALRQHYSAYHKS